MAVAGFFSVCLHAKGCPVEFDYKDSPFVLFGLYKFS